MNTPEADKESMLVRGVQPAPKPDRQRRRRWLMLLAAILCFVLLFVIGIVVGYFVGRNAGKCEDNHAKTTRLKSELDLARIHKDAVDLVSTNQLRDFLK